MSNSKLVNYTRLSPNCNKPRKGKISKITIHHMAGNLSVETCGRVFSGKRKASSNYGIGSDGRVGMYVEEKNRAWTSSNAANDNVAVTIEVANDGGAKTNWHVSDTALRKLIDLCVDICRRNGIQRLNYTGNKNGNLTRHNMFAATTCPGPYLQSKFPYIAEEVNKILEGKNEEPQKIEELQENNTENDEIKIGDKVTISGPLFISSNATKAAGNVKAKVTYITRIAKGAKHPYNTTGDLGWMDKSSIKLFDAQNKQEIKNYTEYKVVKGDNLTKIAKKYGTSWKKIYNDNKAIIGNNPNILKIGQILKIYK